MAGSKRWHEQPATSSSSWPEQEDEESEEDAAYSYSSYSNYFYHFYHFYYYYYCCCCLAGVGVDHDADGGDGGVHVREAKDDLLVVPCSRAGALVAAVADRAVRGGELAVVDEL